MTVRHPVKSMPINQHQAFYKPDCASCRPTNSVRGLKGIDGYNCYGAKCAREYMSPKAVGIYLHKISHCYCITNAFYVWLKAV